MPHSIYNPDPDSYYSVIARSTIVRLNRILYPELQHTTRPTVDGLMVDAAVIKQLIGHRLWPDNGAVVSFDPDEHSGVLPFRHRVGEGLHYINNQIVKSTNGKKQRGTTSAICILWCVHIICWSNMKVRLTDLWNVAYPSEWMAVLELSMVINAGAKATEPFNPSEQRNIAKALRDLREIRCGALSDMAEELLTSEKTTRGQSPCDYSYK